MQEAIRKAIEEQLPRELGDTLLKRWRELEEAEQQRDGAASLLEKSRERELELRAQLEEAGDVLRREEEVARREQDLDDRERSLEIKDLRQQLECEQKATNRAFGLVESMFRNTVIRRSMMHGTQSVYDSTTGTSKDELVKQGEDEYRD